jgi:hypothetical protein
MLSCTWRRESGGGGEEMVSRFRIREIVLRGGGVATSPCWPRESQGGGGPPTRRTSGEKEKEKKKEKKEKEKEKETEKERHRRVVARVVA